MWACLRGFPTELWEESQEASDSPWTRLVGPNLLLSDDKTCPRRRGFLCRRASALKVDGLLTSDTLWTEAVSLLHNVEKRTIMNLTRRATYGGYSWETADVLSGVSDVLGKTDSFRRVVETIARDAL